MKISPLNSTILRVVILGPPGSGKGTISSRIVRDFRFKHLSGGDLLRSHIIQKTDIGNLAKGFIEKGHLVPDEVISRLIVSELQKLRDKSWLLDGFPRTKPQADYLHNHEKVDVVISLNVPEDEILKRLSGRWTHMPSGRVYNTDFNPPKVPFTDDVTGEPLVQRPDDTSEAIAKRLQIYKQTVLPILDFYDKHGVLHHFVGTTSNEIWPNIHGHLKKHIPDAPPVRDDEKHKNS